MATDWAEIFRQRPDLTPPGHDEAAKAAADSMAAKAWEQCKTLRRAGQEAVAMQRVAPHPSHLSLMTSQNTKRPRFFELHSACSGVTGVLAVGRDAVAKFNAATTLALKST